jgi:hypothetical protein
MSTPNSQPTSYLSAAELVKRCDARTLGDLVSDAGQRVDAAALLTHPNLLAALDDASGEVEAACTMGQRYDPLDLAALTGVSRARLYRLLARLTVCLLWERRPDKGPLPDAYKQALDDLRLLAEGERVFGLVEHQAAGRAGHHVEDARDVADRNGVAFVARGYFGRRVNQMK